MNSPRKRRSERGVLSLAASAEAGAYLIVEPEFSARRNDESGLI
jgi:hypothetical protein